MDILRLLKSKMEIKIKTINWCMNDDQLLEKYKAFWTKIEDLKNIELSALLGYNNRYIYKN